jgi:predicted SprT family Zn-dependent metalloprotease
LNVARLNTRDQREVICHEAAHFVVWQRHGRAARPHGPEWAALVSLAGFEPKATRVGCGLPRRRPVVTSAFRHICPVCHFSKRSARRMPRWRCPECRAIGLDGSLRVERISR